MNASSLEPHCSWERRPDVHPPCEIVPAALCHRKDLECIHTSPRSAPVPDETTLKGDPDKLLMASVTVRDGTNQACSVPEIFFSSILQLP